MYRFINEDEEESLGASFTIKKISDITGGGRGGCAELPRWDRLIYFTRKVPSSLGCRGDPSFRGSARCDFNNLLKLEERPGDPADGCSPIKV